MQHHEAMKRGNHTEQGKKNPSHTIQVSIPTVQVVTSANKTRIRRFHGTCRPEFCYVITNLSEFT